MNKLEGNEHQIQHAVGQYLKGADDLEIAPMVGNFVLVAETVDPDTGGMILATVRAESLPIWTELGMLSMRLKILEANYTAIMMGEFMEGYEDDE